MTATLSRYWTRSSGLRLIVRVFVRRVFRRLRSNREYRESQGRVHRADARRGSHQAARRTSMVVRTEVRWLSRARREGRPPVDRNPPGPEQWPEPAQILSAGLPARAGVFKARWGLNWLFRCLINPPLCGIA